jgi:hypothetical protein
MRTIFDKLNDAYAKYYSPYEHLAVHKKSLCFSKVRSGTRIYKLCHSKGYTYNMSVYLGRDRKRVTATIITTMTGLITRIENLRHELYMDNFLSSPDSFDDLHMKAINCCGTVRPNRKNA